MKVNGKKLVESTRVLDVTLNGEPTSLVLTAVPPGFHEKMRLLGVYQLPTRPQRNKMLGAKVLNELVDDVDSPQWPVYTAAVKTATNRRLAFIVSQGLRNATNVSFDTTLASDTCEGWSTYGDTLYSELVGDGGITEAELYFLVNQISDLDNRFDLKKASEDFLDRQ